ncbi:unnamed protein product [Ixodes persulcatus]
MVLSLFPEFPEPLKKAGSAIKSVTRSLAPQMENMLSNSYSVHCWFGAVPIRTTIATLAAVADQMLMVQNAHQSSRAAVAPAA